ncbi:MAG: glycosyltransferase family 2 protein [Burkholderiaceae bacterium]|nr:glycosyltransferase family 2 protein [Burkholderiaceae bacterium]
MTVIICTLALRARGASLERAIESVVGQEGVIARPLIVINGDRFDPDLRVCLERDPRLDCIYREEANLARAHTAGVKALRTALFSFLDDDDVLLPCALATLAGSIESTDADFVVGNGIIERGGQGSPAYDPSREELARLNSDPAACLSEANWLASCGGLYQLDRIPSDIFDNAVSCFEWTYYALKLATSCRGVLIPECVYRVTDTSDSASKSLDYALEYCRFLRTAIGICRTRRPDLESRWKERCASAYNGAALALRDKGRYWIALRYQVIGLWQPGGFRYIPAFTRLVLDSVVRKRMNSAG